MKLILDRQKKKWNDNRPNKTFGILKYSVFKARLMQTFDDITFHRFGQAQLGYVGLALGMRQFPLLSQLP